MTGIDFSERSIRYARELALRQGQLVEHVHADYLDFETDERFDLITMITCDYCALSREQRLGLLDTFPTLQCFDSEGLRKEIEGQGLVIEEVLGDVAGGPFDPASPEFAVIARKPR